MGESPCCGTDEGVHRLAWWDYGNIVLLGSDIVANEGWAKWRSRLIRVKQDDREMAGLLQANTCVEMDALCVNVTHEQARINYWYKLN